MSNQTKEEHTAQQVRMAQDMAAEFNHLNRGIKSLSGLYAASPDLLKALKELNERVCKDAELYAPNGNEPIWGFIEDAQDAIDKAGG